jgi:hypothetical protein
MTFGSQRHQSLIFVFNGMSVSVITTLKRTRPITLPLSVATLKRQRPREEKFLS